MIASHRLTTNGIATGTGASNTVNTPAVPMTRPNPTPAAITYRTFFSPLVIRVLASERVVATLYDTHPAEALLALGGQARQPMPMGARYRSESSTASRAGGIGSASRSAPCCARERGFHLSCARRSCAASIINQEPGRPKRAASHILGTERFRLVTAPALGSLGAQVACPTRL